ncbi:uncharacterized protein SCHCODRAFT_02640490 [Schizophyllum commune H4-8]|uniref:uncharacterized protein n=1 Tax=Schizophyllum commune (strain H4-8 / FGSC 9210) TaxID=578458 RepID=UPI00215EA349|nr:uncharacterized protein SCHCODRAFT_02640490 [Schizophyllum commune H4-8]KAI5887007.1 hypothetical protein SCHCODRAFT_02640490 [Schizophyllum commune H4-8]
MSFDSQQPSPPQLYDDLEGLDAEDARAWEACPLRPQAQRVDYLMEYWRQARDGSRSQELYSDLKDYRTFVPCPLSPFTRLRAVLIRREYEAAWSDLEAAFVAGKQDFITQEGQLRYAGPPTPAADAPFNYAFALTGYPGIGKTMFLALALLRCLERHWTVILQTSPAKIFIFNSDGVYAIPSPVEPTELAQGLPRSTWCLVDSNTALESVPHHILILDLFLIQATSPRSNRTSWSTKRDMFYLYLIDPMPVDEAQLAFPLKRGAVRSQATDRIIQEYYDRYGPSTRLACAAGSAKPVELWDKRPARRLTEALTDLTLPQLEMLAKHFSQMRLDDDVSSAILLVRPGVTRDVVQVDFVSTHVLLRCSNSLSLSRFELLRHFYRLFASSPKAKAVAGNLLEAHMDHLLPMSYTWSVTKRGDPACEPDSSTKYRMVVYGGSTDTLRIELDDGSTQGPCNEVLAIHEYHSRESIQLEGKYYMPKARNEPTIVSFIYNPTTNTITAFQISVLDQHSVDTEYFSWLKTLRGASADAPAIDLVIISSDPTVSLPHRDTATSVIRSMYDLYLDDLPAPCARSNEPLPKRRRLADAATQTIE